MRRIVPAVVLAVLSLLLTGCPKEDNPIEPTPAGTITTGTSTDIAVVSVGSAGVNIDINKPGHELHGMSVQIPSGAFSQTRELKITSAPITAHKLGSFFHPISPLISIRNGGGYADEVLRVKIPIVLPKGQFAMGFLYNEKTGKVEGLPVIALDSTSIVVATRHFATSDVSGISSAARSRGTGVQDAASVGNIVIASIDEATLLGLTSIETGYRPGTDDWEFTNYGSYLAPGGHCAGQSITAMYYYYEKKKSEGALYRRYDRVQQSKEVLWQDNRRGFRFASVIQEDLRWDGWLFDKLLTIEQTPAYHHLSWKAFALSMLVTGEPQFVGLTSTTGGGHAIVAYRMDLAQGKLYVADPNEPGQEQVIEYVNQQFRPYMTRQNANEPDAKPYPGVGYYAKTSMIDWDKVAARWDEFRSGSIGTKGNNQFPAYKLWVEDGAGYELGDTLTTDLDSLALLPKWAGAADNIAFQVFDASGARLLPEASASYSIVGQGTVKLKPGANALGVAVYAKKGTSWHWLDFRWVTVYLSGYSIEPMSVDGAPIYKNGETEVQYGFRVNSNGSAPKNAKYVWHFGDGTSEVVSYNDSTETHTYSTPGTYTVAVEVYDNAAGKLSGVATATAVIKAGGIWDILYAQTRIAVQFGAENNYSNGTTENDSWEVNNIGGNPEPPAIVWNGTAFSVNFTEYKPVGDLGSDTVQCRIEGKLSADGLTIESMVVYWRHIEYVYSLANKLLWTDEEVIGFTVTGLEGGVATPGTPPYFIESGEDVRNLVSKIKHERRYVYYDPDKPQPDITQSSYVSTNWTEGFPALMVGFQQ